MIIGEKPNRQHFGQGLHIDITQDVVDILE